jgi:hypothetical protein
MATVPFSEFRTGLDHLEFFVPRRADLDQWAKHLDTLGAVHFWDQRAAIHGECHDHVS